MAPETRSSNKQDSDFLKQSLIVIQESLGLLTSRIEKLEVGYNVDATSSGNQNWNDSSSSKHGSALSNSLLKGIKLEIPKFTGTDVLGWLFQVEQFFEFHEVQEEQRITICSFALEGDAREWYKWMFRNKQLSSWQKFTEALTYRFGPSPYEDVHGLLSKLVQTTTVALYQSQFEALVNRTEGLSDVFLLSCFISGLKPAIKRELQLARPKDMIEAI